PMPSVKTTLALSAAALALVGAPRPLHAQAPAADQPAAEPPAEAPKPATAEPAPAPAAQPAPPTSAAPAPTPAKAEANAATEPRPKAAPGPAAEAEHQPSSWFAREPLKLTAGTGSRRFAVTFYGFIEADFIHDSTRSYNDSIGNSLVARKDTYDGNVGRTMFS